MSHIRSLSTAILAAASICLATQLSVPAAIAAPCGNGPTGFSAWLDGYKRQARAGGISERTIATAFAGVSYDPKVIRLDRGQRSFKQSFERFYARRASPALMSRARARLRQHAGLLDRIEKRYGVPKEVIVIIWGMETYFGSGGGQMSILRSLATLAYDCRRSAFFTNELTAALRIVQRGDMSPAQMRGGWAGEIGQAQFLASSYVKYAVDYDGNGRRDLIRSVPDVLASIGNFLKAHGWRRGQPWGPGTANYAVLNYWNRASVYQRTMAKASAILAGRS